MMDCVLISIKPEWVDLILSGKKTIEVRKGLPNLKQPFKVYIYCTKGISPKDILYIAQYDENNNYIGDYLANGKVVAEFNCKAIIEWNKDDYGANCYDIDDDSFESACIPLMSDYWDYGKGKTLYGWRIGDLKVYNEPHDISEFSQSKFIKGLTINKDPSNLINVNRLTTSTRIETKWLSRAPQSWCYVDSKRF